MEHRQVEHARPHQPRDLAHGRITRVEERLPAKTVADQARNLDPQVQRRSQHRAGRQPGHAPTRRQPQCAGDHPQRIDDRCQRGQQKMLEPVQHAALHRADGEYDRGDEHQAHHPGRRRLLCGSETGRDDGPDQPRRQQEGEHRQAGCDQHDPVCDRAGQTPGCGPVACGHEPGEDRDECRCQRAARDDAEQQIGQLESGVVGVQLGADAERPCDDHVAEQAHRGREGKCAGNQQHVARDMALAGGRAGHGVSAVRAALASA